MNRRTAALTTLLALLAAPGAGRTQAPAAAPPDLEIYPAGTQVEVRWTDGTTRYAGTAASAAVRGGALVLVGGEKELATLRASNGTTHSGRQIRYTFATRAFEVSAAAGGR